MCALVVPVPLLLDASGESLHSHQSQPSPSSLLSASRSSHVGGAPATLYDALSVSGLFVASHEDSSPQAVHRVPKGPHPDVVVFVAQRLREVQNHYYTGIHGGMHWSDTFTSSGSPSFASSLSSTRHHPVYHPGGGSRVQVRNPTFSSSVGEQGSTVAPSVSVRSASSAVGFTMATASGATAAGGAVAAAMAASAEYYASHRGSLSVEIPELSASSGSLDMARYGTSGRGIGVTYGAISRSVSRHQRHPSHTRGMQFSLPRHRYPSASSGSGNRPVPGRDEGTEAMSQSQEPTVQEGDDEYYDGYDEEEAEEDIFERESFQEMDFYHSNPHHIVAHPLTSSLVRSGDSSMGRSRTRTAASHPPRSTSQERSPS